MYKIACSNNIKIQPAIMARNHGQKHNALIVFVTGPQSVVIMANDVITHRALITAYVIKNINKRFSTISALSKSTVRVIEVGTSAMVTVGFPHSLSVKGDRLRYF